MKDLFPEFYPPTADELQNYWENGIFAFDANVLLDVFRFSPSASSQLLDTIAALGDRAWLPNQAAVEYQQQWRKVVSTQLAAYEGAALRLDPSLTDLEKALNKYKDTSVLLKPVHEALSELKAALKRVADEHARLVPSEELHDRLTTLFQGKVGAAYSADDLEKHYVEAEKRIAAKVAPGFKDKSKDKPERYGDVIIWFQLIDHARATGKPLVFVTGDSKEDWWWVESGKTILPQPSLRKEMREKAKVPFYAYSTESLLINQTPYLRVPVAEATIAEARDAGKQAHNASFHLSVPPSHSSEWTSEGNRFLRYLMSPSASATGSAAPEEFNLSQFLSTVGKTASAQDYAKSSSFNSFLASIGKTQHVRQVIDADGVPIDFSLAASYSPDRSPSPSLLKMVKGGNATFRFSFPDNWYELDDAALLAIFHSGY